MLFATDPDDPDQRRLTKDEIIDNTLLLILAGSETSAATLTNCILLLGLDKQRKESTEKTKDNDSTMAWDKLIQELKIKDIDSSSHFSFDRDILDMLTYTDGVVRESLRIKPVIGGSMRGTKATIVVDGYQIPAGWGLAYDRYNTHVLDPARFREDLSHMNVIQGFEPGQWSTAIENNSQDFIPFGVGPRYCLGADLAMVEMKIFLGVFAQKVKNFDLIYPYVKDVDQATDIKWRQTCVIPIPEDGVIIQIEPR
jgi:cytochrome P450